MGCLKRLHFYCAICVTPSSCWYYWMSILWLCWYYCSYCGISMNSSVYAVWHYTVQRLFLFACPFLCPLFSAETEWGVSFVSTLHLREWVCVCVCVLRGVGERETACTHWKKEMSDWTKHGHHFHRWQRIFSVDWQSFYLQICDGWTFAPFTCKSFICWILPTEIQMAGCG